MAVHRELVVVVLVLLEVVVVGGGGGEVVLVEDVEVGVVVVVVEVEVVEDVEDVEDVEVVSQSVVEVGGGGGTDVVESEEVVLLVVGGRDVVESEEVVLLLEGGSVVVEIEEVVLLMGGGTQPHGSKDSRSVAMYRSKSPRPPQVSEELPLQAKLHCESSTFTVLFARTLPHQHSLPNSVPANGKPSASQAAKQDSVVKVEESTSADQERARPCCELSE